MTSRTLGIPVLLVTMIASVGLAETNILCTDPDEAARIDPDYAVQGEYLGKAQGVQVIALGKGEFEAVIYQGGLPGLGWKGDNLKKDEQKKTIQRRNGDAADIAQLTRSMQKLIRQSPTLGAAPPKGAVVLFDGSKECMAHWTKGKMSEDHLLTQGAMSKDTFKDCTIHLEFRLPYKPEARGQGRGNSGIYVLGRYEVQMLDSFGLEGRDNECGGIYKTAVPRINMCLPPLTWQTYDIDMTAPKFDSTGKKTADARITVRHNGVVIHDNVACPKPTTAFPKQYKDESQPGPIYLQDHGNPVRYRNIWVLPR